MRTIAIGVVSAFVATLATGCATPPTTEFDAARAKVQAAAAEGATYAPDALKKAQDAVAQLDAEITTQGEKFALTRSYDRALELAASAEMAADNVQKTAAAEKERLLAETGRMVADAKRQLTETEQAVEKAPRSEAPALKADVAAAAAKLEEVASLIASGEVRKAHSQAEAASQSVTQISTTMEQARAEAAKAQVVAPGDVRIPRAVLADGKRLPAGTYRVRVTDEQLPPVAGQTPGSSRWIEFVRNGTVAGRALAVVLSAQEVGQVAKGHGPGPNDSRVDDLRGGEYVRVWVNRRGVNYLAHLPPA